MAKRNMEEYILMHKDIPVCIMNISEDGALGSYRIISGNSEHIPLGGQLNEVRFHDWWKDRAIPKTRHGVKNALQRLGYSSTNSALVNNLALSLSDCYWIKPRNEDISWSEVSLFTNEFVDSFGEITLNKDSMLDLRNKTRFSCATSQGELQKKWCVDNNKRRYLVKGNFGESYQQSLNEIFATMLHKQQGFSNYTEYFLTNIMTDGGIEGLGCLSYDFCSEKVESISAWEILQMIKVKPNESYYLPLKKQCLMLGMKESDFVHFIDYQIITDYLMTNTDRHMNNISILRNPDTLEILGFAPIYDSGNSMLYNIPLEKMDTIKLEDIKTHSFIAREEKLLSYVEDRQAVDLNKAEMSFEIYNKDTIERQIRIPKIKEIYERKMERLSVFQRGTNLWNSKKVYFRNVSR